MKRHAAIEAAAAYMGAPGTEEDVDPLCLWSKAQAWESNPPTIYIGYDDKCFFDKPVTETDPKAVYGAAPRKNRLGELYMEL